VKVNREIKTHTIKELELLCVEVTFYCIRVR